MHMHIAFNRNPVFALCKAPAAALDQLCLRSQPRGFFADSSTGARVGMLGPWVSVDLALDLRWIGRCWDSWEFSYEGWGFLFDGSAD